MKTIYIVQFLNKEYYKDWVTLLDGRFENYDLACKRLYNELDAYPQSSFRIVEQTERIVLHVEGKK